MSEPTREGGDLQSLARAVMGQLGECLAYPGRPSQCDPEVCDCFMADNLVRLMDAVRADERAALARTAPDEWREAVEAVVGEAASHSGRSSPAESPEYRKALSALLARADAVTQRAEVAEERVRRMADWKREAEQETEMRQAAEAECARLRAEIERAYRSGSEAQ